MLIKLGDNEYKQLTLEQEEEKLKNIKGEIKE